MSLAPAEHHYPLLSGKAFADFSPEEYLAYVKSLYREPERATKASYSARISLKGILTIRVSREGGFLTLAEIDQIATDLGMTKQEAWNAVRSRGIEVRAKDCLRVIAPKGKPARKKLASAKKAGAESKKGGESGKAKKRSRDNILESASADAGRCQAAP